MPLDRFPRPAVQLPSRLATDGWPVVLVRVHAENEPWWIQPPIEKIVDNQFSSRIHFGNKDTPKGTKFAVVVLVAKNKDEARKFKDGAKLKELPAGLPLPGRSRKSSCNRSSSFPP